MTLSMIIEQMKYLSYQKANFKLFKIREDFDIFEALKAAEIKFLLVIRETERFKEKMN